jgi:DNA helicase-2/ATP-dependent DNA helicase PcrA
MRKSLEESFISLRKKIIHSEFKKMNSEQYRAVTHVYGPLLVLAGAGSGKTTTIVNRIANMVVYGDAYNSYLVPENLSQEILHDLEKKFKNNSFDIKFKNFLSVNRIPPEKILSITFTNKAANELKQRLSELLLEQATLVTSCTFHSFCAKVLREFASYLGFSSHFNIYDTDDSIRLIKICQQELNISKKILTHNSVLKKISRAKDNVIEPEKYLLSSRKEERYVFEIFKIYDLYQKKLKSLDAMDFDDLIFNSILLLKTSEEVLETLRLRYSHILIDEYQDTNKAQHVLINKLFKKSLNVCAVGDDDQSIYSFRGADFTNILDFEKIYPNTQIIKLERNYRSTKNILDAANSVIKHNNSRKNKTLCTKNKIGKKIKVHTVLDEISEAKYVANKILKLTQNGYKLKDIAVLYRMNSQSSFLERAFIRAGIPYKIIGGICFYDRAEIKDIIAYFSVINNENDEIRLRRIINTPKRSIGNVTISKVMQIADENNCGFLDIARRAGDFLELSRASCKLTTFAKLVDSVSQRFKTGNFSLYELYEMVLRETNYLEALLLENEASKSRFENIKELGTNIKRYEEELGGKASLQKFLEEISLINDIKDREKNPDRVSMMTVHASKGLEFSIVFLPGMEEGLFPKMQISSGNKINENIEEERRLAYVAITRAKERLYMVNADARMLFGSITHNQPSRFIREIPNELISSTELQFLNKSEIRKHFYRFRNKRRKDMSFFEISNKPTQYNDDDKIMCSLKSGDRIQHKVFGEGSVISAKPVAKDLLLNVSFDKFGLKKLMFKFSPIKKVSV